MTLRSANETYTETITALASIYDISLDANATFDGDIDNFSVRKSTNSLPTGFKPKKVWAGGILQTEGTDFDVTYDGFIYGISFFIEPATNVQVEGVLS